MIKFLRRKSAQVDAVSNEHPKEHYNQEIQILRAIAVLAVMLHHLPTLFTWKVDKFQSLIDGLWVGVDLFFCISGYVIAKSLIPKISGKHGPEFWRETAAFWLRRFYRIAPSAWFWAIVTVVSGYYCTFLGTQGFQSPNIADLTAVFLHVFNFHAYACANGAKNCGVLGWYWTLSLEEQFYIFLPIVIFLSRKYLAIVLIGLVLSQTFVDRSAWSSLYQFVRTDAIALGVLIAILSHSPVYMQLDPQLNQSNLKYFLPLFLLASLFTTTTLNVVSFSTGLAAIICGIIVFICSYDKGYMFGMLPFRSIFSWIGARSYALYLIHIPIYWISREIWIRSAKPSFVFTDKYTFRFLIVAIPAIFILSDLNFRLIEEPFRRLGKVKAAGFLARNVSLGRRPDERSQSLSEP